MKIQQALIFISESPDVDRVSGLRQTGLRTFIIMKITSVLELIDITIWIYLVFPKSETGT